MGTESSEAGAGLGELLDICGIEVDSVGGTAGEVVGFALTFGVISTAMGRKGDFLDLERTRVVCL